MKDLQFIQKDGKPVFVVIPYAEWVTIEAMIASAEDIRLYDDARIRSKERFPPAVIDSIVAGEHPVKVFREHRGLTQRQLAEQIGVTPLYLSHIERGRRQGSMRLMHKISRSLRIALDLLVSPYQAHES